MAVPSPLCQKQLTLCISTARRSPKSPKLPKVWSKRLSITLKEAVRLHQRSPEKAFLKQRQCENGTLRSVPIQALFDGFDSWQPMEVSYDIISCEVADDVAMVAINSQFGDAKYTDMFTLVKDGVVWKIVSKVYHTKK